MKFENKIQEYLLFDESIDKEYEDFEEGVTVKSAPIDQFLLDLKNKLTSDTDNKRLSLDIIYKDGEVRFKYKD